MGNLRTRPAALLTPLLVPVAAGIVAACAAPPAATPTLPPRTSTPAITATAPAATAVPPVPQVPGGNRMFGIMAIHRFGCGSCHTIPGVPGATGTDAPSLAGWANQSRILGEVPNTPDNLIRYIQDPQAVVPSSTMPNLHVPEPDARNIAAYLFTLR